MSFSFGSSTNNNNNTNNTWGSSTGFGRRASVATGPTATTSTPGNSLFGNNNTTSSSTTNSGQGLFGSGNASTTNPGQGLFGGGSNNTSTTSGGLFGGGNANTSGQGLFGGGNSNSNTGTGGLFGGSKPSTGLFGNSNQSTTSGGGFNPSGGLFGSTNKTTGGLFGNSSQIGSSQQSGGLFGGQTSNNNNLTSNLQPPSMQLTVNNTNPYSYSQVFSNLQASTANMPESITTSVFSGNNSDSQEKKRRFSYLENPEAHKHPKPPSSSSSSTSSSSSSSTLLKKLGQTFRYIRDGNASASIASLKGLFTTNDILKPQDKKFLIAKNGTSSITPKSISRPSYKAVDARRIGSMKRLIIKSKPVKYHLIDVNKVFNNKRRKIVTNFATADKLLTNKPISDDESDSDQDDVIITDKKFARYSYKVGKNTEVDDIKEKSTTRIFEHDFKKNTVDNVSPAKPESPLPPHDGYWTSPSIKDLSEMTIDQLSSLDNFIIGRIGCGQIAYNYPVDLSQIYLQAEKNGIPLEEELFEKVVEINPRVILTYKNYTNKPSIGFGLNVPATITLEDIKPKENVSIDEHINFLKKQIGMEFITYDPITHVWVFKVKHFSVWGLVEEDQKDLFAMKRKQDKQELEATSEYSKIYETEKYKQELKKQKLNEQSKIVPGGWSYNIPPSDDPLTIKRRLVSNEINKQLVKYKSEDLDQNDEILSAQVSNITIDSDSESTRPETPSNLANYIDQLTNLLPPGVDLNEIVNEKVYEPNITNDVVFDSIQIRPNLPTSDDWLLQLELANQMTSALAPFAAEPKKISDRSLDIEKIDNLLFSDFNKKSISTPTKKGGLKTIDDIDDESQDIFNDNIPIIFLKLLSKSTFETHDKTTYPYVKDTKDFEFKDLITTAQEKEEKDIVTLASALFDKIEENKETTSDPNVSRILVERERKNLLTNWLKLYNTKDVSKLLEDNKDDLLELTFIHLCAGDLKKAIETAIKANSNHLSVIVTLSDSNDDVVRSIAKNQLTYWTTKKIMASIPKPIVKIYQLLAGEFTPIIDNLSWNMGLGVKLFYDNFTDIKELISEVETNLPENNPIGDVFRLYTDNNSNNLSLIESSTLNEKLKWFFCKILGVPQYDTICERFGDYLKSKNYWKESLYVFSELKNEENAKTLIRDLIISKIQYIKNVDIDKEDYLINVAKVPRTLIYEAIAIDKNKQGDYWGECLALIEVELWEKANTTIIKYLGPLTVISNSQSDRNLLQELIHRFPHHGMTIPDWNQGTGIYEKFFSLNESDLRFLFTNLPLVNRHDGLSNDQKIALNLISKTVGDLVLENDDSDGLDKTKILEFPLGQVNKSYFEARLK
ncbi:hypothetical protein SBY92_003151 [Candida maltosa Xu316]